MKNIDDENMTSTTQLQNEIRETRTYLHRLESQLRKAQYGRSPGRETEQQRIKRLQADFKRKYPNVAIDWSILKLVGTLPSRGSDRRLIAKAIAEKYGK